MDIYKGKSLKRLLKNKVFLGGVILWALSLLTLLLIPVYKNKINDLRAKREIQERYSLKNMYQTLPENIKEQIDSYYCALIMMKDGLIHLVGEECGGSISSSIKENMIYLALDDPLIDMNIERLRAREEYIQIEKKLSAMQKSLLFNRRGAVIKSRSGKYYFVTDINYLK